MLRISKILNNNAVIIIDDQCKEKVIVGTGVGFQKKPGEEVDSSKIRKIYSLSTDDLNSKFQEILSALPIERLDILEKIIEEIKLSLGKKISDSIYVSLLDHINFSLINYEKGIQVSNALLFDIMRFYPEEYKIGKKALKIIEDCTGISLSNDEAGFIALHIVNAETENAVSTKEIYKATKIIEEILGIVKNYFDVEIDEDSLTYFRFVNHLRYFSLRIVNHSIFKDDEKDRKLLDVLSKMYIQSYQCCLNIKRFIKVTYDTNIGYEELLYLTIHVQRAIFKD